MEAPANCISNTIAFFFLSFLETLLLVKEKFATLIMYTRLYIKNDAFDKQLFKSRRAGAWSQHKSLSISATAVFFPLKKITALETNSFWSCLMTIYSFL